MPEAAAADHPLAPWLCRVVRAEQRTEDVTTLWLERLQGGPAPCRPGQFNMLTAFGVGEAAISVSGPPAAVGPIEHTVRDVGAVTHALCSLGPGDVAGVRGPFGTDWGVDDVADADVVVVAGGIGLAPLRGAVEHLVAGMGRPGGARAVSVLVGARVPDQIVFGEDFERWRNAGAQVEVTVDAAESGWEGRVGVVTTLLPGAGFEPGRSIALVCGPEIMMRFAIRALHERGLGQEQIRVSLERNMQCGVGLCGHCQLGPLLLCRDGPVVTLAGGVERLLAQRQR